MEPTRGSEFVGDSRAAGVHVQSIRKKIEPDPKDPRYSQTMRGTRYKSSPSCSRALRTYLERKRREICLKSRLRTRRFLSPLLIARRAVLLFKSLRAIAFFIVTTSLGLRYRYAAFCSSRRSFFLSSSRRARSSSVRSPCSAAMISSNCSPW